MPVSGAVLSDKHGKTVSSQAGLETFTFTAKRYTFPYPRMRKNLLVRIVAMLTRMIERGTQVREREAVYGYGNENGNDGESGHPEGAGDSQSHAPEE